ncbi:vitellogenin [Drosophila grimshawi]|uniref:vitellogenin n=1 Tax=Drosophila grimshawi TaxID=7222 RepID=UPI001C933FBA|nr:vitellogenin [Drosophila grimshawi]
MWSTLLLPLLLLHLIQLHATVAMATASGGLTVIEGASTSTSSSSSTSTTSSTTTISSRHSSSSNSSISSITSSNTSSAVTALNLRKRHRKRNSNWYDYRNYSENNTAVEWMNPCGGSYYTPSASESRRAQRPKQIFNQLKRAAGTEYRELNSTQDHKGIDIGDMQVWSLHKYNYKFLPKLKPNSTIALKRWYRNMQTYVASFAYLRRVQINWDRQNLKRESAIAKELKRLLLSSRSMLCELETAVNRTYPMPLTLGVSAKQRRQLQLPQISRNDMNRRLKLRSKMRPAAAAAAAAATTTEAASVAATAIGEADPMDMRFVKHHYYEFLRTMWQLLRRDSKRERQQRRQKRQRRQQRQREQQHQQQQSPLALSGTSEDKILSKD